MSRGSACFQAYERSHGSEARHPADLEGMSQARGATFSSGCHPRTRLRDHVVRNILKVKTEWLDGRSKQRSVHLGLKVWRGHPASCKGARYPRRQSKVKKAQGVANCSAEEARWPCDRADVEDSSL